jgi:hypothetical protein
LKDEDFDHLSIYSRTLEKNIQDLKYSDITEKIIKAAFKVHTAIGPGFQEIIYQRALKIELALMALVGLLLNFGRPSLELKRFVNSKVP